MRIPGGARQHLPQSQKWTSLESPRAPAPSSEQSCPPPPPASPTPHCWVVRTQGTVGNQKQDQWDGLGKVREEGGISER